MNERSKQLAIEAGLYVDLKGEPWPKWLGAEECEVAYARFAELLIQECVSVVEKRFMGDLNREDMEVQRCAEDLKKHFGVEL